jgi:branched-chain amino acid transport system substrate-binding protein
MEKTRREFMKMTGGAALGSGLVLGGLGRAAHAKPPKGVPSKPVKIGVVCPLSGAAAALGEAGWRATQIWADRVNAAGGILGRKVELHWEDETKGKETVERFRKLTLRTECDVVVGTISTGVALAVLPIAEELGQLFLSWDGTSQKQFDETVPDPKYVFRSCNNEAEAVAGALMTAEYFPDIRRVVGINLDYSYGRNCMAAFKTVLQHHNPKAEVVLELWPKWGTTDYTAHVLAIKKEKPDLVMSSHPIQDAPIFLKQAHPAGLFKEAKGAFVSAGLIHEDLKKEFTPEGMILGYNALFFEWTDAWPLLRDFNKEYYARFKAYPANDSDHAYFVVEAYKVAVERAYALTGKWPTKEQVAKILPNTEVACPSGYRGYSHDKRMLANYFMGTTTHNNPYDFVTIENVRMWSAAQTQTPYGMKFYDWVKGWGK